jgi:hypothetical protein
MSLIPYNWKLQPYQKVMFEYMSTVPEGYKVEFYRGIRGMRILAIAKDEPMLQYKFGEWKPFLMSMEIVHRPPLKGYSCGAIFFDEFNEHPIKIELSLKDPTQETPKIRTWLDNVARLMNEIDPRIWEREYFGSWDDINK